MFRLKQLFVNETLSLTQKNEGETVRHSRQVKRQGNCKIYLLNIYGQERCQMKYGLELSECRKNLLKSKWSPCEDKLSRQHADKEGDGMNATTELCV